MSVNDLKTETMPQRQVTELEAEVLQLRQENEQLQQSDHSPHIHSHWLSTIATVANLLLRSPDYTAVLPDVVRLLGEAVGSDRCGIGQNIAHPTSGRPAIKARPEWDWCKAGVFGSEEFSSHSDLFFLEDDAPYICKKLALGEVINCLVTDLPEPDCSLLRRQGNTSELFVPIFVDRQYWGFFAFDNCGKPRLYDDAEVAMLKIAADSVAAAIERQAKDEALLQLEQSRSQELEHLNIELQQMLDQLEARDRLLEATAKATNVLLTLGDFDTAVDTALKMLVEGSGCDRINILENSFDTSPIPTYLTVIYEWVRPGIIRQLSSLESGQISSEGIEAFLEQHYLRGDGFGGLLDKWDEPLRNLFAAVEIKSSYAVPIRVKGQWWGALCLDYCQSAIEISPAEVAVLKTIADCIGSAIQRDRTQKAILQAEQERSQELQRINTELQQTLDRLTEAEDSLNTLFDLSTVGFYFGRIDPPISITLPVEEQCEQLYQNFRVMRANQAFADMYGVAHPEEVVGMGNPDCHVEASEKNKAFFRGIVESGYNFRNLETEEIDRHGQQRYFLNSGTKVIQDGHYTGGWSTQVDVTELRLAQQALLQAQQDRVTELARTNQALRNNLDRLAAEPNLDAFLGHVLTEISQQLNMHTAWLYRYDPQYQTLQLNNWVEQGTVQPTERFAELEDLAQPISIANTPLWDRLNQTKYPFVITPDNAAQFVFSGTEDWQLQWAQQHGIRLIHKLN